MVPAAGYRDVSRRLSHGIQINQKEIAAAQAAANQWRIGVGALANVKVSRKVTNVPGMPKGSIRIKSRL